MFSVIEFLNRLLTIVSNLVKRKKEEKLQDDYKKINEDLEDYATGDASDGNSGVFTPDGKKPNVSDLRKNARTKQ